jgi:hypothetical protein
MVSLANAEGQNFSAVNSLLMPGNPITVIDFGEADN